MHLKLYLGTGLAVSLLACGSRISDSANTAVIDALISSPDPGRSHPRA